MKGPSIGRRSAPRDPREGRASERPNEPHERRDSERPHEPHESHEPRGDEPPLPPRGVDALRAAALRSALEAAARSKVRKQQPRRSLERAMRHQLFEAARFLYAIVETGESLRAALDFAREPALRLDRLSQLLAAIDKAGGCPSFSHLGRALRVSRQAAREIVLAAERAGRVELFADPFDRRSLQVGLTPSGRRELERRRVPASDWTLTLLNGLPPQAMRTTAQVLGVIRERLRRNERDLKHPFGR
jgi:DNA-binding MarR family transcriptional regulator